jgi:hypothetical protein
VRKNHVVHPLSRFPPLGVAESEYESGLLTEWDTGDRVIVHFGGRPFALTGGDSVSARSFVMRKAKP